MEEGTEENFVWHSFPRYCSSQHRDKWIARCLIRPKTTFRVLWLTWKNGLHFLGISNIWEVDDSVLANAFVIWLNLHNLLALKEEWEAHRTNWFLRDYSHGVHCTCSQFIVIKFILKLFLGYRRSRRTRTKVPYILAINNGFPLLPPPSNSIKLILQRAAQTTLKVLISFTDKSFSALSKWIATTTASRPQYPLLVIVRILLGCGCGIIIITTELWVFWFGRARRKFITEKSPKKTSPLLLISGQGGQSKDGGGYATTSQKRDTEWGPETGKRGRKVAIIYGRLHGSLPERSIYTQRLSRPHSWPPFMDVSCANNEFSWYFHGFMLSPPQQNRATRSRGR